MEPQHPQAPSWQYLFLAYSEVFEIGADFRL